MPHKKKARVFHFDLFGKREDKYDFLNRNSMKTIDWKELDVKEPYYFFVKKDFETNKRYDQGFRINELFRLISSGIKTHRDHFVIDYDIPTLKERIQQFYNSQLEDEQVKDMFRLKDNRDWNLSESRKLGQFDASKTQSILYRPFDLRPIYYEYSLIDFGRENVMQNIISGSLAFLCFRQSRNNEKGTFFISKTIVGKDAISSLDTCSVFPLYIYPPINVQQTIDGYQERTPNLNLEIVQKIAKNIGLAFIPEKDISAGSTVKGTFAPIDILDYIYAVLHSPTYREKYKEFLKIDFPRIPYPENAQIFWQLVELGGELRQIHLLESPKLKQYITTYLKDGDNHITRKITPKDWELYDTENNLGRVHINNGQYFDPIPLTVWEFYIGGYQPAQKWLKDRRGRTLSYDDVLHYQKIIAALTETDRIMKQIDSVWLVG